MATEKDTLIHEIIWDDGDASKKADAWNDKLQKSEQSSHALADAFFKISEALIEFSVNAGRNFAKFEEDLSHARRTMNLSREETLALGDSLIDLAANFDEAGLKAGVSANELAKITGILGQLGISAQFVGQEAFENLTVTTAKLSVAFGMSSGKAAEFLGILSNLYDLPVENLENVASSVTVLGNSTVATAQQILDIMQRIGGIGGLLGVTAQEAAALAATVREAGVSTQVGGTALSQVFSRLASDVDKFAEVLGKGGLRESMLRFQLESGNATDALKSVLQAIQNINASRGKIAAAQALKDLGLTGVRVQQTLLALSNNLGGLNENLALSEQAYRENIAVNEAYQSAIDNTWQKWDQFKNLLDIITKVIGKGLSLAFGDFLEEHLIPFTQDFSEWLQQSQGAEKIFGREGIIANALDFFGEKLTENKQNIFTWLDSIDVSVAGVIQTIQANIGKWSAQMQQEIQILINDMTALVKLTTEALKLFIELATKVANAWEALESPIKAWREWTEDNRQSLKDIGEGALGLGKIFTDKLAGAIEYVRQQAALLGKEMVYSSILPDIGDATLEVTKKTIGYGETLHGLTTTMDRLYQIGTTTWTNLFREIESGNQLWSRSLDEINTDIHDVEFNLYQTADAVANLGWMYEQTGDKAEKAMHKATEATEAAAVKVMEIIKAQATISEGLQRLGFSGLDSNTLLSMARIPGLFDAQGLIGLQQLARGNQPHISQQPGAMTSSQGAGYAGQQAAIPLTLVIEGSETARLAAVMRAEDRAYGRQLTSGFGH